MKCYTCGSQKPREEFVTSYSKQCFDCSNRDFKTCPDCKKTLPLGEFKYKTGDKLYGYCKECRKERGRKYDAKRGESAEGRLKKLLSSRKRDTSAQSREWRENNPDYRERGRIYRKENRVRLLASRQNQRARSLGVSGILRVQDWVWLLELFNGACACFNEHDIDSNNPLSIDHVRPLKIGGHNCIHNIQPLCRRCNMRKGISEIDFRTDEIIRRIYERYPECEVALGRDCCRTEFEIRAGFFKGRPSWQEDS